jgi:DnaJ-class molecular chaperone
MKMKCKTCEGTGVVPHVKRQIGPEGAKVDDPSDFQIEELCSTCGATGEVPYVDEQTTS